MRFSGPGGHRIHNCREVWMFEWLNVWMVDGLTVWRSLPRFVDPSIFREMPFGLRGNHLSKTTCLPHVFFKRMVSSHSFSSQQIKLRVSNPRNIAYLHFKCPSKFKSPRGWAHLSRLNIRKLAARSLLCGSGQTWGYERRRMAPSQKRARLGVCIYIYIYIYIHTYLHILILCNV